MTSYSRRALKKMTYKADNRTLTEDLRALCKKRAQKRARWNPTRNSSKCKEKGRTTVRGQKEQNNVKMVLKIQKNGDDKLQNNKHGKFHYIEKRSQNRSKWFISNKDSIQIKLLKSQPDTKNENKNIAYLHESSIKKSIKKILMTSSPRPHLQFLGVVL